MTQTRSCAMASLHPAVPALYFAFALVVGMCAVHPVLVAVSLAGALCLSWEVRGPRATGRSALIALPMAALVALVNPFVSATGETVLFSLLGRPFTLEAVIFGLCMGGMLAAVVVWCEDAACAIDDEGLMALIGRVAPTLALVVSMTARLVPTFLRRATQADLAQKANTAACADDAGPHSGRRGAVRRMGALLSWSLADSVNAADSMAARGWTAEGPRTAYRRFGLSHRDKALLAAVAALGAAYAAGAWALCAGFGFYPVVSQGGSLAVQAVSTAAAVAFLAFPTAVEAKEAVEWTR